MKKFILLCCMLSFIIGVNAQTMTKVALPKTYKYRVYLKDKKHNDYSVKKPEKFLSEKSLQRRKKYGIAVDNIDLPVTSSYLDKLRKSGLKVCHTSKWNNTVVVETSNKSLMQGVKALPFVDSVRLVYVSPDSIEIVTERSVVESSAWKTTKNFHGVGHKQAVMIGADKLHQAGFRGKGVTIAVIDGGFHNADVIPAMKKLHILGTRNFVNPGRSVYQEQEHGLMVLSCIGTNEPGAMVGTAPEASFYLLLSEDGASEFPVEEDNWCAAVEYADSLGCDIITSSLGYHQFDDKSMSHKYYELNGHTAINSRSASLAASRGILLLNSAGNSGTSPWKKIGCPADAENILAVGAVRGDSLNTNFSSLGNSADGRVKPDVMAMGYASRLVMPDGTLGQANGTSFACPIMCGGVACLLQAFPDRRPEEIMESVRQSGNNATHPDNVFGYGIPNLWKAYEKLSGKKK